MRKDTLNWLTSVFAKNTFTRASQLGRSVEQLNIWLLKFWHVPVMERWIPFWTDFKLIITVIIIAGRRLVESWCSHVWHAHRKSSLQCWEPQEDHRNNLERKAKSSSLLNAWCARFDPSTDEASSFTALGKWPGRWLGSSFTSILQEC